MSPLCHNFVGDLFLVRPKMQLARWAWILSKARRYLADRVGSTDPRGLYLPLPSTRTDRGLPSDEAVARDWLKTPNSHLHQVVLQLLDDIGAEAVRLPSPLFKASPAD